MSMEQTWRWFGPQDPVSLMDARQAGAMGIVSALHHLPFGAVWEVEEIMQRKKVIEEAGLRWLVAESIPVHENIKTRTGRYQEYLENYKQSVRNLGKCGIHTLCYNFMPVLDATRTDFNYRLADGSIALLYDAIALAAFELYLLKRPGADSFYADDQKEQAKKYLEGLSEEQVAALVRTVVAGFPGVGADYTLEQFQTVLDTYRHIGAAELKANLAHFLREVVPVAEEAGVKMAIHPDDPPFPVLGLPRIVSTEQDVRELLSVVDSPYNGFTMCTGSFGVRADNDLAGMVQRLGHRMNFVHLRSTIREESGSFYESDHLTGDVDMYSVIKAVLEEQQKRREAGWEDYLPMRPDHGHQMLDDLHKKTIPGYSAIGRLRGLAEIRGLELGIRRTFNLE